MFSIKQVLLVVGILLAILAVPATASAEVPQNWSPIVRANYTACKKAPKRAGLTWNEYIAPCRVQYSTESGLPDGTSITRADWFVNSDQTETAFDAGPNDPVTDPPNLQASFTYTKVGRYGAGVRVTLSDGSTRFGRLYENDIGIVDPLDADTGPPSVSSTIKGGLFTVKTDKKLYVSWTGGGKKGIGKVIKQVRIGSLYQYTVRIKAPKGKVRLSFALTGKHLSFYYNLTRRVV